VFGRLAMIFLQWQRLIAAEAESEILTTLGQNISLEEHTFARGIIARKETNQRIISEKEKRTEPVSAYKRKRPCADLRGQSSWPTFFCEKKEKHNISE